MDNGSNSNFYDYKYNVDIFPNSFAANQVKTIIINKIYYCKLINIFISYVMVVFMEVLLQQWYFTAYLLVVYFWTNILCFSLKKIY